MSELPPLPSGFQLEAQSGPPPLPDGFQIEQPQKFGLGDTWPARLAKDIYSAVTLPGDVYQGNATVPQSGNMPGGENTDSIARVTNLAGLVTPMAPGSAVTKFVEAPTPSMAATKEAATSVYENPAVRRTLVPQQEVAATGSQALETFVKDHKQVAGIAREMENTKPWDTTIDKLNSWSDRLGSFGKEMQMGRAGPEPTPKAAAAMSLKNKVDELISNSSPAWREADQNYAAFKAAQGFDKRAVKSDVLSRGGDYAARLATQATQMLANPRATRGMTADQLEMLRQISRGTTTQRSLAWFSDLLGNRLKHGIGTLIGGGAGLAGGPVGGAMGALGGAAVDAAIAKTAMSVRNGLANRQTREVVQSLLSSSPLARSLPSIPVMQTPSMAQLPANQLLPLLSGYRQLGLLPAAADQQ